MCKPKPSPSALAQLAAPQRGQRGSCPHIRFSVRSNRKVGFYFAVPSNTRFLMLSAPAALGRFENSWFCLLSTATIPSSWDQTTPICLKSSSSSQTAWPTSRLKAKTRAANGWPTSSVKYRSVVGAAAVSGRRSWRKMAINDFLLGYCIWVFYCNFLVTTVVVKVLSGGKKRILII